MSIRTALCPVDSRPEHSHLDGFRVVEVLNDAPGTVHEPPGNRVLAAFFIHSQSSAINVHTTEYMRHAPLPFDCLAHPSSYVHSANCEHSGDVRLTELELLGHLNRQLLDHMCRKLPRIREIWTNGPDCKK